MELKFEDLQAVDIAGAAIPDIASGAAEVQGDKIIYKYYPLAVDTPYCINVLEQERECTKWHKIYFMKFKILPRNCMHCWKVVCRPKNLDELLELNDLQKKMDIPGKCGMEIRETETYKGFYLGFWYCPLGDLEGAREVYKEVRRHVRGALSLDSPVILKRGCTEMENAFGPSHLWQYTFETRFQEELLDTTIVVDEKKPPQSAVIQTHVIAFWIHYAHRMGDKSAAKHIRNYPQSMGSVPTTTYHDVLPEIKEEVVPHEIAIQRLPEN